MNNKGFKVIITFSAALMFALIAFNNMIDYCTNFRLVRTVVSMESVHDTAIEWRAITSPTLQHAIYYLIISWESLTALVCFTGGVLMLSGIKSTKGKNIAQAGLLMGFSLFMFGFVIVAGEWFYLWGSTLAPMHTKAILLSLFLASCTYFVSR